MKNLVDYIQEGILDSADKAIHNYDNKVKKIAEISEWCNIIKDAFKHNKNMSKIAEYLNKTGIYLNNGSTKNMEWTFDIGPMYDGDVSKVCGNLWFWLEWTVPMIFFSKHSNNELYIEFMCDYERDDYTEKDLLKMYNLSKSEFNELKENIILAMNAKMLKTTSGIKYIVKL